MDIISACREVGHLTGRQPGNEPAFMPAYEAARSRVGTQSAPV